MVGGQVLVVEDNERNMKLFRDVLAASGYRTLEAKTGGEAVELVRRHRPQVVLLARNANRDSELVSNEVYHAAVSTRFRL